MSRHDKFSGASKTEKEAGDRSYGRRQEIWPDAGVSRYVRRKEILQEAGDISGGRKYGRRQESVYKAEGRR